MRPIWKGLWKDPVSGLALFWLITLSMTALMAYFVAPVSTEYANEMLPSKALVPPGTKALVYVQRDAKRGGWERFTDGQLQPVQIHPVADFKKTVRPTICCRRAGRMKSDSAFVQQRMKCSNAAFGSGRIAMVATSFRGSSSVHAFPCPWVLWPCSYRCS